MEQNVNFSELSEKDKLISAKIYKKIKNLKITILFFLFFTYILITISFYLAISNSYINKDVEVIIFSIASFLMILFTLLIFIKNILLKNIFSIFGFLCSLLFSGYGIVFLYFHSMPYSYYYISLIIIPILGLILLSTFIAYLVLINKSKKYDLQYIIKKQEKENLKKSKLMEKQALKEAKQKQKQISKINKINLQKQDINMNNQSSNNAQQMQIYNYSLKQIIIMITYIIFSILVLSLLFISINKMNQLGYIPTGFPSSTSYSSSEQTNLTNIPKLLDTTSIFMGISFLIVLMSLGNWLLKLFKPILINQKHIILTKLILLGLGTLISFISLIIISFLQSKTHNVILPLISILFTLIFFIVDVTYVFLEKNYK